MLMLGCTEEEPEVEEPTAICPEEIDLSGIASRSFLMGFSTWTYGPENADIIATYDFVLNNGDIYSEQVDGKIPWDAWINGSDLPDDFVSGVTARAEQKPAAMNSMLSVSLLNTDRTALVEDWVSGQAPSFTHWDDQDLEDAYFKHVDYLIGLFDPDYVVLAMETNEVLMHSPDHWQEYKSLMGQIRTRVRSKYPDIKLSESMTLHNWYLAEVDDPVAYSAEIASYLNQMDFAAISFYPFFKGLNTQAGYQSAFDFLHDLVTIPIAFVETNHIAEDLDIPGYNLFIASDECQQQDYLHTLFLNADAQDYEIIIWWAHRDYDALWESFPDEVKDVGQIWRDTGLLDQEGGERPAFNSWQTVLSK